MHKETTKCPHCKFAHIYGGYSALEPHVWYWESSGNDEPDDYEIKYCPNCGKLLPAYPTLTNAQFSAWYNAQGD